MKTVLASVYALNPQKGSEDGMGWNFVCQIAKHQKVIAITRENNQPHIEAYLENNPNAIYKNIEFLYYDLPSYLRFWKRGSFGAMPYYYLWQLFLPLFVVAKKLSYDLVHNLNFHNDWTPSMLWTLGKPMIWGPVGHHPKIPKNYILSTYGWKAYLKDRATWMMKQYFWKIGPLLKLTKYKADHIFAMNSSVQGRLNVPSSKINIMPSVASEDVVFNENETKEKFTILSAGRFVPLKGFDVTIKAFANFYHQLTHKEQQKVELTLVGKGPQREFLENLTKLLKVEEAVTFIDWIERKALQDIYKKSSTFLFPSHEGAGMVVSEALSYGLPVLCFDNVGPGEFVDNNCGRKVAYSEYDKSVVEFAQHLTELFRNTSTARQLSKNARMQFENTFAWDVRGEQLKAVYDRVGAIQESTKEEKYAKLTLVKV